MKSYVKPTLEINFVRAKEKISSVADWLGTNGNGISCDENSITTYYFASDGIHNY